ncbi:NAD(P)/FAD-dependent oxidoreductase [Tellurirhabdus rosea]|uniref:NAD(P)/FAD-dependent oxidoreductase n=1 Tax=Tellurirhabdus rosea TaxID=2674997 RepID=UPI00224F8332|nr:NAD(P)/FAD-dependent oxidoreductase [Tellurirhabdus rosea]
MRSIVIIGNGISGITAARHIRQQSDDRITVISSETDHFYSRTALMYVYMGHLEAHHTKPYEDGFWAKNRIELLRADVLSVNFDKKELALAQFPPPGSNVKTPTGFEYTYDVLVLATGSKPNFADWPGKQLRGVQGLYGMPDLERMEVTTRGIRQAVIVGGGLIGIELCEMLQSRGIQVTFLVRERSFWNSVLPDEESALVTDHIREHSIDLRLETEVAEFRGNHEEEVQAVVTTAGEVIPTQFAGIAIGVSPNIDWLKDTSLETNRGILVNEYLETSQPEVYAIGDCVQHRNPPLGRKSVEQIWYTGRIMGETVARTILGERTRYEPGIFFNSAKFFDIEYQTYGDVPARLPDDGSLQTFYWAHPDGRKAFRINYRTDTGAVAGMNTLGIRQRQEVWQRWIEQGKSVQFVLERLAEANFDPEFYKRYEVEIVEKFNAENHGAKVSVTRRKGFFERLGF